MAVDVVISMSIVVDCRMDGGGEEKLAGRQDTVERYLAGRQDTAGRYLAGRQDTAGR